MTKVESSESGRFSRIVFIAPYLCTVLIFIAICAGMYKAGKADGVYCHVTSFCDARVYASAIGAYSAGSDPYVRGPNGMDFLYPPVFLRVAGFLAGMLPTSYGWRVYVSLLWVGIFVISWALTKFVRSDWMSPVGVCVLFILEPKFLTERALLFGNLATVCYACLLAAAIPGIWRNRWSWFYVAVFFAASLKPPFLTLLIVPWLGGVRQFWRCVSTALLVGAGYLVQRTADPRLFTGFLDSVHRQLIETRDHGMGIMGMLYKVSGKIPAVGERVVFLITAAIIFGLVLSLAWLRKYRALPEIDRVWMPTLLVAAILSNPRMIYYDAYVVFVPTVFLFVEWALSLPPTKFRPVWIAAPLAIFLAVFSVGPETAIFILIAFSLAVTIFRMATGAFAVIRRESVGRLQAVG